MMPVLHQGMTVSIGGTLARDLGFLVIKLFVFGSLCLFFSVYVEKRITSFFTGMGHSPDPMLMVVGFGFIITGLAALLGFSMAMGAFFAGLVFSRDPDAVKLDASMEALSDLFVPFFFIGIGLKLDPRALSSSLGWIGLLLMVAVLSKLIGNGLLSLTVTGWTPALLISVSMIPRAEITMVIMQKGHELGEWAVPQEVFSSMVLVAFITSLIGPIWLRPLLTRCPQDAKQIETG
jgi:Kef-type K+ transport system membrane component KefB